MNQDLKNYIDQARAAGKNDDAIKQELRGAGWQESDISEGFGGSISSAPVTASVAASASSSATKWIAMAVVGVLVLGAGAYFAFGRNGGASDSNFGSDNSTSKKSSGSMECKDLLPDGKFKEITGINDFELHQSGIDVTAQGLNELPGNPGTGDLAIASGVQQRNCGYVYTAKGKESSAQSQTAVGDPVFGSDIMYTVVWGGAGAPQAYDISKQTDLDFSKGKETTFNGQSFTIPANPDMTPVDVSGVGSAAYFSEGYITVLSTNKKYMFSFIENKNVSLSKEKQTALAKVIDSNLK